MKLAGCQTFGAVEQFSVRPLKNHRSELRNSAKILAIETSIAFFIRRQDICEGIGEEKRENCVETKLFFTDSDSHLI